MLPLTSLEITKDKPNLTPEEAAAKYQEVRKECLTTNQSPFVQALAEERREEETRGRESLHWGGGISVPVQVTWILNFGGQIRQVETASIYTLPIWEGARLAA